VKALKKFHGAPPKREPTGERFQIGVRLTSEHKRRLDVAAEESGRSQSQEVEIRLAHTFDRQDLLPEVLILAYGREIAGILMIIGHAMRDIFQSESLASTLSADTAVFKRAVEAASVLLAAAGPPLRSSKVDFGDYPKDVIKYAKGVIDALLGDDEDDASLLFRDRKAILSLVDRTALRKMQKRLQDEEKS
jgi:TraY domain